MGRIGARTGNNGNLSVCRFHAGSDELLVLVFGDGRRFARRPARNYAMRPARNMPFDKLLKSIHVHLALFKGGDDSDDGARKLFFSHVSSPQGLWPTLTFR